MTQTPNKAQQKQKVPRPATDGDPLLRDLSALDLETIDAAELDQIELDRFRQSFGS